MDIILLTLTIIMSLYIEYGQTSGPRNITRTEGAADVTIICHFQPVYATPFWKINDKLYYYSDIPPPLIASRSGRDIYIPIVHSSLNGTSFQCFAPSSSGNDLVGSSVGVLTVTESGNNQIQIQQAPQTKLTLDHQRLFFTADSFTLGWKISSYNETSGHYQIIVGGNCASGSNRKVIENYINAESESIVLQPGDLSGETNSSLHLNITLFDEENVVFLTIETFQFVFGIITEEVHICTTNSNTTSSCIKIPPLNGRQTLMLAIPFLPPVTGLEEDILCPVHLHIFERCVDLLRCNRLRDTVFANSITICREANNDSSLEMCFHNVTGLMNGTKVHFFYSDLDCTVSNDMPVSSRTYARSLQLIIENVTNYLSLAMSSTMDGNIKVCISKCYQDAAILRLKGCNLNKGLSIIDGKNCGQFTIDRACASVYHIELETYTNKTYSWPLREISGYNNSLDAQPLKCSCQEKDKGSLSRSTQTSVIILFVIIFCIIATLFSAIVVTSIINCKALL